ncbi:hypothetical protein ACFVOR_09000 [Streptomyces sp. NPDC057837]|uniref:hypothetical protein n=1 Tax=Streptomyces sp. NPDC057837 TaxID=3346260 RepID=UPI0036C9D6B9
MTADQLPAAVREFATYLDGLLARVDPSGGWCAVFWQRNPEGMRACLDGREVPPWDVVESLLADLAGANGPGGAGPETEHARFLHTAALAAYDSRPGGGEALGDRLDAMLREQKYAAERQAALARQLTSATTRDQADALRVDLAWARDDLARATARCAELRARMARADRYRQPVTAGEWAGASAPRGPVGEAGQDRGNGGRQASASAPGRGVPGVAASGTAPAPGPASAPGPAPAPGTAPAPGLASASGPAPAPGTAPAPGLAPAPGPAPASAQPRSAPRPSAPSTPKPRRRRRGGARFAGAVDEDDAPVVVPVAVPVLPVPETPAGGNGPRGARFAGAAEETVAERPAGEGAAAGDADRHEVARVVETLARLRGEGRSGEAHALLAEAASWGPARFPLLAELLHRTGLDADWQTLLWEAASLPAGQLVAAADALAAAGRASDARQLLRQGVARPPDEIGRAVLALADEGRHREVRVLLDAYVTARTPEEAARSADPDPRRLVPLLLEAAAGVSDERRWDLLHALRVAGHPA